MENTKLIILRGPSGSGKSTVAKAIQKEQLTQGRKMAYVEQDYLRRILLKEKDIAGGFNIQFIKDTVIYLLEKGFDVIMEGIFDSSRYEDMFKEIVAVHHANNFFFYFDISLEETLKRHNTKPNKDDFGEEEMRRWYKEKDFLTFVKEEIIQEDSKEEETAKMIQSIAS